MGGELHNMKAEGEGDDPSVGMNHARPVRKNGFETPLDPLQILSWVIIVFLAASFAGLLAPMLNDDWHIASLVVYLTLLVVVVSSAYECARRDPIDACISKPEEELIGIPDLLKCSACSSRVNRLSRHCLICDKCVVNYDHHCKWLNNCIGEDNYRPFLFLLGSAMLLVAWQLVFGTILFTHYVGSGVSIAVDVSDCPINKELWFVLVCVNLVLGVPALLLVTHLVGFHFFLNYQGLTTYNYVMQQQAKQEAKAMQTKGTANKYIDKEESSEYETDEEDEEGVTPDEPLEKGANKEVSKKQDGDDGAPCVGKCIEVPTAIISAGGEIEKPGEMCASGIPGVITSDGDVEKGMSVSVHVNKAQMPPGFLDDAPSQSGDTPLTASKSGSGSSGSSHGSPMRPPHRLAPLNAGADGLVAASPPGSGL